MPSPDATVARLVRMAAGSSQPWFCELADGSSWLVKFAGAGPGLDALLAELIANQLGRLWGLPIPETQPVFLGPSVPRAGTDELWDVLDASRGWNLAIREVPEAVGVVPDAALPPSTLGPMACFDAVLANWDRTTLSRNLLRDADGELWWIDHGSCRFLHHLDRRRRPALPANHFLIESQHSVAPAPLRPLSREEIQSAVTVAPDQWLTHAAYDPASLSDAIARYLDAVL